MIYQLTKNFTQIAETTGTIQNTSHIYTLEMSQSNVEDSGIFIYPLQSKSFTNQNIYLRCADGAGAEARVYPFTDNNSEAFSDISAIFNDLFENAVYDVSFDNSSIVFLNRSYQVLKRFNLPEEIYLKSLGTSFAPNFVWSAATYPNSTNPNLDGKPVLVLHIKGDSLDDPYEDWGFVNFGDIINTKANKASNPTAGNVPILDQNGNLVDSGYSLLDVGLNSSSDISGFTNALRQAFGFSQGG